MRHLQTAAQQAAVRVHLTWEPFLLNAQMNEEGEDLREHILQKYGPRGARMVDDPNSHLMQMGRAVGIHFTNQRKIYPTVKVSVVGSEKKTIDTPNNNNHCLDEGLHEY